jgi:hypothetical protein
MTGMVKGTGMTWGVTNGIQNSGIVYVAGAYVCAFENAYGKSVSPTDGSNNDHTLGQLGITTNSSKSGIVVDRTTSKYLNFYIN